MFGIVREVNCNEFAIVETRNDYIGDIRVYNIPETLDIDRTIEFDLRTDTNNDYYGVFVRIPERNNINLNTEDRDFWYALGNEKELEFINNIVPQLGLNIIINPEKQNDPTVIDLYDQQNQIYCDLKVQNTPFFTAGRYMYQNDTPYDPTYTVTFNRMDYERYSRYYPDCDIYFWVHWTNTRYRDYQVNPLTGVWRASFRDMAEAIEHNSVVLHNYQFRRNDDHNARNSYLFSLLDTTIFERLM